MKVDFVSKCLGKTVIHFMSPWEKGITFVKGDVIGCEDKPYKIVNIDSIFQGCFGAPKFRMHSVMVEPMGHENQPKADQEINLHPEV